MPAFIDRQIVFNQLPTTGYDRERYLANDRDYYNNYYLPGLDRGGQSREAIDFTKIPTEMEEKIMSNYFMAPSEGTARLAMRCKSQVLDNALIKMHGYKQAFNTAQCTQFRVEDTPSQGQAEAELSEFFIPE